MSTQEVPEWLSRLAAEKRIVKETCGKVHPHMDSMCLPDGKHDVEYLVISKDIILSHMIDKQQVEEARFAEIDEIFNTFVHDPQRVEALVIRKRNEARQALNIGKEE